MKKILSLFFILAISVLLIACEPPSIAEEAIIEPAISLSSSTLNLNVGESKPLGVSVQGFAASQLRYVSEDTSIAIVNAAGVVTALNAGATVVTASYQGLAEVVVVFVLPDLTVVSSEPAATVVDVQLNSDGEVVLVYSDGTLENTGLKAVVEGEQATIRSATVNASGNLVLTMTDGTTFDAGRVVGPSGPSGPTGPSGASSAGTGTQGPAGISITGVTLQGTNLVFTRSGGASNLTVSVASLLSGGGSSSLTIEGILAELGIDTIQWNTILTLLDINNDVNFDPSGLRQLLGFTQAELEAITNSQGLLSYNRYKEFYPGYLGSEEEWIRELAFGELVINVDVVVSSFISDIYFPAIEGQTSGIYGVDYLFGSGLSDGTAPSDDIELSGALFLAAYPENITSSNILQNIVRRGTGAFFQGLLEDGLVISNSGVARTLKGAIISPNDQFPKAVPIFKNDPFNEYFNQIQFAGWSAPNLEFQLDNFFVTTKSGVQFVIADGATVQANYEPIRTTILTELNATINYGFQNSELISYLTERYAQINQLPFVQSITTGDNYATTNDRSVFSLDCGSEIGACFVDENGYVITASTNESNFIRDFYTPMVGALLTDGFDIDTKVKISDFPNRLLNQVPQTALNSAIEYDADGFLTGLNLSVSSTVPVRTLLPNWSEELFTTSNFTFTNQTITYNSIELNSILNSLLFLGYEGHYTHVESESFFIPLRLGFYVLELYDNYADDGNGATTNVWILEDFNEANLISLGLESSVIAGLLENYDSDDKDSYFEIDEDEIYVDYYLYYDYAEVGYEITIPAGAFWTYRYLVSGYSDNLPLLKVVPLESGFTLTEIEGNGEQSFGNTTEDTSSPNKILFQYSQDVNGYIIEGNLAGNDIQKWDLFYVIMSSSGILRESGILLSSGFEEAKSTTSSTNDGYIQLTQPFGYEVFFSNDGNQFVSESQGFRILGGTNASATFFLLGEQYTNVLIDQPDSRNQSPGLMFITSVSASNLNLSDGDLLFIRSEVNYPDDTIISRYVLIHDIADPVINPLMIGTTNERSPFVAKAGDLIKILVSANEPVSNQNIITYPNRNDSDFNIFRVNNVIMQTSGFNRSNTANPGPNEPATTSLQSEAYTLVTNNHITVRVAAEDLEGYFTFSGLKFIDRSGREGNLLDSSDFDNEVWVDAVASTIETSGINGVTGSGVSTASGLLNTLPFFIVSGLIELELEIRETYNTITEGLVNYEIYFEEAESNDYPSGILSEVLLFSGVTSGLNNLSTISGLINTLNFYNGLYSLRVVLTDFVGNENVYEYLLFIENDLEIVDMLVELGTSNTHNFTVFMSTFYTLSGATNLTGADLTVKFLTTGGNVIVNDSQLFTNIVFNNSITEGSKTFTFTVTQAVSNVTSIEITIKPSGVAKFKEFILESPLGDGETQVVFTQSDSDQLVGY